MVEIRVLSKAVIEMQQALSEKFGIPTFNLQGQVSTIPTTRPLNTAINVNTGATGLSVNAFNELLKKFTPTEFKVADRFVNSPQTGTTRQPIDSLLTPSETVVSNPSSLFSTLSPYTNYLVLGALGLLAISLVKRI